jgi:hypothetical protein
VDKKILLGIVSRAPNKYTDKDELLSDIDDDSSSSAGSDPDANEISAKKTMMMKKSTFNDTFKSSSRKKLNQLDDDMGGELNPEEFNGSTVDQRFWYGTNSPPEAKGSTVKLRLEAKSN